MHLKIDLKALRRKVQRLTAGANVRYPSMDALRRMSEPHGIATRHKSLTFISCVRNRSSALTVYVGNPRVWNANLSPRQREILEAVPSTLETLFRYLNRIPLVGIKRRMGKNSSFSPLCTMLTSTRRPECVRLPYMWGNSLFPPAGATGPNLYLVYVPEWHEKDRQILVFPEAGVTFVLGSDYFGEAKKGFLRMGMWFAKEKGNLGLHAGSKILLARNAEGRLRKLGMILFGLSGTGKTTHACHDHGLRGKGEGVRIVQDDVVILLPNGSALGTEKGFFIKTEGLDRKSQPLLYGAATTERAIFENVMVDPSGELDFRDLTLTGNGRGIVQMSDLAPYAGPSINLPPLSRLDGLILAFITRRNTVLPLASRLNPEQAAAAFMMGESIETSAGDPKKAGQSVRVVGTNPFIVGDEALEGNWFYRFLQTHGDKVQTYLLNTGGVGEKLGKVAGGLWAIKRPVTRVEISEMSAIIRGIAKGSIAWKKDPRWGVDVPSEVPGMDVRKYDYRRFYERREIEEYVRQIRMDRIEYMKKFPRLYADIPQSLESPPL